ncbi:uncharacterized protein PAC_09604 [Phialocephala subalpina]|uniref:Uncharacterized protein n=1 Tax=Phialocephala subalpina TaxID=576137 RepID=A0A1L7X3W5_9HELO|nr:uncharacterized protein PAC_09604 [Phialocephala subalpina]
MCIDYRYRWENCRAVEIHHRVCQAHIQHTRLQKDDNPCPNFRVEEINYRNDPVVSICQCKIYGQPCIRNTNGLKGDRNEHWEFEYVKTDRTWPEYKASHEREPEAEDKDKGVDKGKGIEEAPVENPYKKHKGESSKGMQSNEDMDMEDSASSYVKDEYEKTSEELEEDMKGVKGFYYYGVLQTGDEMDSIR